MRTQPCPAFPVRALAGRYLPLFASYLKLGLELVLWQLSPPVMLGQHKLQAAALVYVDKVAPRTSAPRLWYHDRSWERIKDVISRPPTTSTSTCAAGLAASASRLSVSQLVSLLAHPCWCFCMAPDATWHCRHSCCTYAGSVCMAPIQLGFE